MATREILALDTATPQILAPQTGDTYIANRAVEIAPQAGSKALTLTGGTQTTSQPVIDATQTWNAAGVTFTGIKFNVTDTASAAGSLLMNLQVGGATRFSVQKNGLVSINTGIGGSGYVSVSSFISGSSLVLDNAFQDVTLARDAANTLAQRNGVNAQIFRIYNTYTDASNYERGILKWDTNVLKIGVEIGGTGSNRNIEFVNGATRFLRIPATAGLELFNSTNREVYIGWDAIGIRSDAALLWSSSTAIGQGSGDTGLVRAAANIVRVSDGSTGGGAVQLTEMTAPAAPAANNVRIYAVDNGSGKTQLMALFATGAAQQIAIEP